MLDLAQDILVKTQHFYLSEALALVHPFFEVDRSNLHAFAILPLQISKFVLENLSLLAALLQK